MSIPQVGSLKGTKVISTKTGASATSVPGDKVNTNSSAVSKTKVPKGSTQAKGPTNN